MFICYWLNNICAWQWVVIIIHTLTVESIKTCSYHRDIYTSLYHIWYCWSTLYTIGSTPLMLSGQGPYHLFHLPFNQFISHGKSINLEKNWRNLRSIINNIWNCLLSVMSWHTIKILFNNTIQLYLLSIKYFFWISSKIQINLIIKKQNEHSPPIDPKWALSNWLYHGETNWFLKGSDVVYIELVNAVVVDHSFLPQNKIKTMKQNDWQLH